jgi:ceramide glucosyltransferase
MQIENQFIDIFSGVCVAAACFGCLYLLAASIAVLRFPQRRSPTSFRPEPVTILKPLHGAEPGLARRLRSFCDQDYDAPIQVVCGVQDPADAAIPTVTRLAAQIPRVELKVDGRNRGSNPKVSNLGNMFALARHDLIVLADSDIEVGPDYLAAIVAQLQSPGVGAVSCFYHGVPAAGVWSRQAALAINSHLLPDAVLAWSCGLAQPCFGSTLALHRSTLRRIGGFESFADCLADDYAIGAAVRAEGRKIAMPTFSVSHACFDRSLPSLLAHELRAARTIKSITPIGYAGAILTHPFPLALIGAVLGGGHGLGLAAIALACRGVLCLCVEHAFGLTRQPYWLIPFHDLVSFAAHVAGLFGTTVKWRGFTYRLSWDGRLTPDRNRAEP